MDDGRKSLRDYAGRKEGQRLEFKDPRVLREPYVVAREACALLNSSGGEIVIGVRDDGTLAPIADAAAEVDRLRDRLASLIAPSLPARVRVDVLDGGGVLVTVDPPEAGRRELFAVRSTRGRMGVFRRVGDRIVALDWGEVREELGGQDAGSRVADGPDESAEKTLIDWREKREPGVLRDAGGLLAVWTLDPRFGAETARRGLELARQALEDPSSIGLRRHGVNYSVGECHKKRFALLSGSKDELYKELQLDLRGSLRFATRLDTLLADRIPGCPRDRTVYPLSLIELLVSCTVLFATVVEPADHGIVTCALDLVGIDRHSLPPFPHGTYGFLLDRHWKEAHQGTRLTEILKSSIDARTFAKNPHRMAHELITWIYEEFGYDDHDLGADGEKIPYWNAAAERFVFPS